MAPETRYADVEAGVRAAIARYNAAVDDGRTEDVVATYCPDGACDIPGLGAHAGHDALRSAYAAVEPTRPQRHVVTNTHLTDWNADEATAVSDFLFLTLGEAGWKVRLVGRYRDTLHRTPDGWRFHRREGEF
ncbi:MAG TPA: nuclear transport factor 2 family protein, partial [Mycobacteriales bacterium]|nr:nuclear transport factor 2 family protein [Mycobacteriales bacterium]